VSGILSSTDPNAVLSPMNLRDENPRTDERPPMYGEPGGLQGEVTLAQLLADAGYAT